VNSLIGGAPDQQAEERVMGKVITSALVAALVLGLGYLVLRSFILEPRLLLGGEGLEETGSTSFADFFAASFRRGR